jgi:hypothetical protein
MLCRMAESRFDDWIAERYDVLWRNASAHLERLLRHRELHPGAATAATW